MGRVVVAAAPEEPATYAAAGVKTGEDPIPSRPFWRKLAAVLPFGAMRAPQNAHPEGAHTKGGHIGREDAHTDVVPLVCGSVSGVLLAGLLLASGLERISLGVPQLLGAGEAHEPVAERAIRP
jgi:hypothetical protein